MALPSSMSTGGIAPERYGVRFVAYPSDPSFGVEIQFSTAAAAATSKWSVRRLQPSIGNQIVFTQEVPPSTKATFARARHWGLGYSDGPFTPTTSAIPGRLVDVQPRPTGTGASDYLNPLGSVLPIVAGLTIFTGTWGGTTKMRIALSWGAQTLYRPDGTTVVIAASSTLPAPGTPTLNTPAGGTLGARTYWVRIGYVKDGAIWNVSAENTTAVTANHLLQVLKPAAVAGYDGWIPLVGQTSNNERADTVDVPLASPLSFTSDWTEPTTGADLTGTLYSSAMLNAVTYVDLSPSTAYVFYPYYDPALTAVRFAGGALLAVSAVNAGTQNADGKVPLQFGSGTVSIGISGGSGSVALGTGKYT